MTGIRIGDYEFLPRGGIRVLRLKETVPSQLAETDPRRGALKEKMAERHRKFQEDVAAAIQGFDPLTDRVEDFNLDPVSEIIRKSTVEEMSEMCGYDKVQKELLDFILLQRISKPLEAIIKEKSNSKSKEYARLFNLGYVCGQIERCFPGLTNANKDVVKLRMDRAHLQYIVSSAMELQENEKPADFATKCKFIRKSLSDIFPPEDKEDIDVAMKLIESNGSWFLTDIDKNDELVVDKNEAGMLAARAVVDFAQQMYPQRDEGKILAALDDLVSAPDAKLITIAQMKDRGRKDPVIDAQIILFAARAANYSWALSVIPQGFAEQKRELEGMPEGLSDEEKRAKLAEWQERKPKLGLGRYSYGPERKNYFTTFDNMSDAKGWPAVLLDMDQIRTGIRILRTEYNAKLSESSHSDKTQ